VEESSWSVRCCGFEDTSLSSSGLCACGSSVLGVFGTGIGGSVRGI
jgi:hypothetical protein